MIVAPSLFVYVAEQVERLNRYIGSAQSALQERPEILDSLSVDFPVHVVLKVVENFVSELTRQILVALKFVGMNFRAGENIFADNLVHDDFSSLRNDGSSYRSAAFQHSHDYGFRPVVLPHFHAETARLVHVPGVPADKGLIHFDRSAAPAQLDDASRLQSESQAMQNEPCGFLGDPHSLCDFVRTDAVLAVDQHPERGEPFVQLDRGFLENGAQFHRELLIALFALPALLGRKVVVLFVAASWAFRAVRPAQAGYGVNADLLV